MSLQSLISLCNILPLFFKKNEPQIDGFLSRFRCS